METTFWKGFVEALDCDFKDLESIQGISGITHKIVCLGIDENLKRIIIVQDEQDARILAMVQADVQARYQGYSVLMVRPVPINLSQVFGAIAMMFGSFHLKEEHLTQLSLAKDGGKLTALQEEKVHNIISILDPQISLIGKTKLNIAGAIKEVVQQLSHIKMSIGLGENKHFDFDFQRLINFNPIVYDNAVGVCPIPLYEFSEKDADCLLTYSSKDQIRDVLKQHAILQFFYPPIDTLALGLVDTGRYQTQSLETALLQVPNTGHILSSNEIISYQRLPDIIDGLKEKGLIAEGEIQLEVTAEGQSQRMTVKFRPREGVFKRLANIFSLKVDINLKDLFNK